MTDQTIWEALEPVALGVGWFTIACLIAWTVCAVVADIARQVRKARHDDYRAQVEQATRTRGKQ